jgi:hypothetical protein
MVVLRTHLFILVLHGLSPLRYATGTVYQFICPRVPNVVTILSLFDYSTVVRFQVLTAASRAFWDIAPLCSKRSTLQLCSYLLECTNCKDPQNASYLPPVTSSPLDPKYCQQHLLIIFVLLLCGRDPASVTNNRRRILV